MFATPRFRYIEALLHISLELGQGLSFVLPSTTLYKGSSLSSRVLDNKVKLRSCIKNIPNSILSHAYANSQLTSIHM